MAEKLRGIYHTEGSIPIPGKRETSREEENIQENKDHTITIIFSDVQLGAGKMAQ